LGTRYVLNTTIFGQHLTATNHRTLSHTTSLLHTGYYWLHAVATMYQICVVLVVHTDSDTKLFGDKSHERIHLYTKDDITHYDALVPVPVSTGEDDGSSARKRRKNGGPAIETDSDRSPIQVVKGARPGASSSMVAGQSSRHDGTHVPLIALADAVVVSLGGVLSRNQLPSPPGKWARRSGQKVQQSGDRSQVQGGDGGHTHGPVGGSKATAVQDAKRTSTPVAKRTGTPVVDLTNPGNAAAVRSGDKSKHQGGNGGQAGGQGGISKATAVPRSVMPQIPPVKEGVQKKTTVLVSNPIPPQVSSSASSSASRHKTCEHNKRRTRCPKCNGKSLCLHQKQKLHCRECRKTGAFATCRSFCEHGRQRSRCKDCGGSGICQHGRDKYRCSQCR